MYSKILQYDHHIALYSVPYYLALSEVAAINNKVVYPQLIVIIVMLALQTRSVSISTIFEIRAI